MAAGSAGFYGDVGEHGSTPAKEQEQVNTGRGALLIILLVLALISVLPTWGYSTSWGYAPGGVVGLLLVIVIVLALLRRI